MGIRIMLKKLLPEVLVNEIHLQRRKHYLDTIVDYVNMMEVSYCGQDSDGDWYISIKNGIKLFGHRPDGLEKQMYRKIKHRINPIITESAFPIALQAITSFFYPQSYPNEVMKLNICDREMFGIRQADMIPDFDIAEEVKNQLGERFTPHKGETFVEVGAFIGQSTLRHALDQGEESIIIAFEADAENYRIAQKNIIANNVENVRLFHKAVGDKPGQIKMFSEGRQDQSFFSELVGGTTRTYPVEVVTLDDALKDLSIDSVHHVSLTVNGFEPEVVDGMRNTIMNSADLRISAAGWYYRDGGYVHELLRERLEKEGMTVLVGKKGRVLAYK